MIKFEALQETINDLIIITSNLETLHGGEFYPIFTYRKDGYEFIINWIKDKNKAIEKPIVWCRIYSEDTTPEGIEKAYKDLLYASEHAEEAE